MVQREQVASERGRRWIDGSLSTEDYFRAARQRAREQARTNVAARLQRAGKPVATSER